ncbi:hypothetical protein [Umezawaea tangerina]|uniref:Uncharacterized protein n=1 Tax=Umezawaea tangerina TaxID=84725 RepID=A0A2T0TCR9_9PSEU|nr:hypothetical protein [Umezawaea tangerina]PRY43462.1 hypothetical protein CLV43_103205 [Umezawaea tangerina]
MGKRGGWVASGSVVGWILVTTLGVADTFDPAAALPTAMVAGVFLGGLGGAFLGFMSCLIHESLTTPPAPPPPPRPAIPPWPVHAVTGTVDLWGGLVLRCEASAGRVAAAVQTVPDSPAKAWMARIAFQLQQELVHVHNIARLARALGTTDRDHPALQRLLAATHDFAAFESEVGLVALKLLDNPELARSRTDLEFLEKQLPHLKG